MDLAAHTVDFDKLEPIAYDYLVLGLGAEVNFFGTEGAAEHAFPMYTLPDAVRLKEHVLERWEAADRDPALVDDGALNVVVVGGGPTGVETAGALAELYRSGVRLRLPGPAAGEGARRARRGRAGALPDVQGRHPLVHGRRARETVGRGRHRRGRRRRSRPRG